MTARTAPPWALPLLGVAILACVVAGNAAPGPGKYGDLEGADTLRYVGWALAAGVPYVVSVWMVRRRVLPGWALWAVLGVGLLARLLVWAGPPLMSTDLYRYVWDGRVQMQGINPYRYVPADPALSGLRDPYEGAASIFDNINRPATAPTIYPPAAQALFAAIGAVGGGVWTMKAVMLGFDLAVAAIGIALLRAAGLPAVQVAVWMWNPLVIREFAGAGHIDAAGIAASALALLLAVRGRAGPGGAALGMAVLFKLLPAALFPALWRPRGPFLWRVPVAAGAVILLGYAAYASVGWGVFGYLSGYAQEEGLDGGGLLLLRLLGASGSAARLAYLAGGAVLLAGIAAWVAFRPGRGAGARVIALEALLLSAGLIAVLSPHYPWYLAMLVMPAMVVPAWAALWPSVAGPLLYFDTGRSGLIWAAIVFLPAIPLAAIDVMALRRGGR